MKSFMLLFLSILYSYTACGQEKFLTKQGYISFFSSAPVEDIKADNNQVLSIIDTTDGSIAISILMKSFMFEKSLMQEHFNENYVESDVYPKSIFRGQIRGYKDIQGDKQLATIVGDITIHGVTKKIEIQCNITKTEEKILLTGDFTVNVADFKIKIPSVVVNNIAESIKISFTLDHKPYKK